MAQRMTTDCDLCGTQDVKDPLRLSTVVGTYLDGAGDTDTREAEVDVCAGCQKKLLVRAFKLLVEDEEDPYGRFCMLLGGAKRPRVNPPFNAN